MTIKGTQKSSEANINPSENETRNQIAKSIGMSHDTYTNLRQRGDISSSSLKMGRIILELERIYGVSHGGDRKSNSDNTSLISQEELAKQYNMSIDKYRNSEKLLELIPELQDMIQEKTLSVTVASRVLARLSPAEHQSKI